MFDPKYSQSELSEQEKKDAYDFAKLKYPCNFMMSLILKFNDKSSPFEEIFLMRVLSKRSEHIWVVEKSVSSNKKL